jgi:pyruvate/2-oxoglutarate dehydrogenase complex dihydrolipoamide dehydrogenase (E3) component
VNHLAARIGVDTGPARVDLARVRAWKETIKKSQEQWVADLHADGFATFDGDAALVDAHTVRVGGVELEGERLLIATGSRTAVPPVDGIDKIDWIDHVSALELEEVPARLLVVGAGAVGLELAQAFARFGSRVTIVEGVDRIAFRDDEEAAAQLAAALADEGIEVVTGAFVDRVRRDPGALVATVGGREIRVARILLAAGRAPNVEELELERAGIERTKSGIAVDAHLRTSADGVWAAGDVTGMYQFTPIAQYEARVAVADMFTEDAPEADYSVIPTAIFTDPELAGVGKTEAAAREEGLEIDVVTHPLAAVTRAQYTGAKHGLYKVVFERGSRRVVGIHVVNRAASEIVQGLAVAMNLGATVDDLANVHHTYPSLGEGVKAAAEQATA